MGVSKNRATPKLSIFNRVFHDLSPSILAIFPIFGLTPQMELFHDSSAMPWDQLTHSPRGHFSTGLPEVTTGVVKCTSRKTRKSGPRLQPFTSWQGDSKVPILLYSSDQFHIPKMKFKVDFPLPESDFSVSMVDLGVKGTDADFLESNAAQHFSRHLLFDHIIEVQDILLLFLDTNPSTLQPSNPPTLQPVVKADPTPGKTRFHGFHHGRRASVKVTKLMLSKHLQRCSWTASGFLPSANPIDFARDLELVGGIVGGAF